MNVVVALIAITLISSVAAGQLPVDLILVNGNIRTLDKIRPRAEAIAVAGGRIVAVGRNSVIRSLAHRGTKVVDAGGRLVIPGFNDAHVHWTGIGNRFSHLDLKAELHSAGVVQRIAELTRILPKGRWLLGAGLRADIIPSLDEIDAVSPDNPLLIYFTDPASVFVNSAALRKVAGSLTGIKRNDRGTPTGVVTGAAVTVVRNTRPADFYTNLAEIAETASNHAASLGVTSVQDMHSDDLAATLRTMARTGRVKTRVYDCIWLTEWKKLSQGGTRAASGEPMVRTGCVKATADGSKDELPELQRSFAEADKAGLQIMVHAIGERAIANVITAFEYVTARNGRRDRRLRIEHAHRMYNSDIARVTRTAIIPSMQPFLFYAGAGGQSDEYSTMLQKGVKIALGSDASITDFNPLLGVHAAVNAGPGRSITVEQAVTAYTLGSAYAEFQEKEKGSIEVGKLADFVILSEDIFAMDRTRIDRVSVLTTVMDGKVVFEVN